MLKLYHAQRTRSARILWLLEELGAMRWRIANSYRPRRRSRRERHTENSRCLRTARLSSLNQERSSSICSKRAEAAGWRRQ